MRAYAFFTLYSSVLAAGRLFGDDAYLQDTASATPASVPMSGLPIATSISTWEGLELRQAPAIRAIDPALPVPNSPQNPGLAPVNNPAPVVHAVPAITTTSTLLASPGVNKDFVTVQWVETWIGGTSQTWIPKTISFHFQAYMTAPLPGKGEIGMGTLTGKTGKTKTIVVGAAPTQAAGWVRGVAAAVGVGIAGLVV